MEKENIFIIVSIAVILLAVLGGWQFGLFAKIFAGPEPITVPQGILLFFGDGCPHCKNVEDFVVANKIEEKVKFTRLEVPFASKTSPQLVDNAKIAIQLAQKCKIDATNGVGIPFLYDGKGNCVDGDVNVINFFKNEAGIK